MSITAISWGNKSYRVLSIHSHPNKTILAMPRFTPHELPPSELKIFYNKTEKLKTCA